MNHPWFTVLWVSAIAAAMLWFPAAQETQLEAAVTKDSLQAQAAFLERRIGSWRSVSTQWYQQQDREEEMPEVRLSGWDPNARLYGMRSFPSAPTRPLRSLAVLRYFLDGTLRLNFVLGLPARGAFPIGALRTALSSDSNIRSLLQMAIAEAVNVTVPEVELLSVQAGGLSSARRLLDLTLSFGVYVPFRVFVDAPQLQDLSLGQDAQQVITDSLLSRKAAFDAALQGSGVLRGVSGVVFTLGEVQLLTTTTTTEPPIPTPAPPPMFYYVASTLRFDLLLSLSLAALENSIDDLSLQLANNDSVAELLISSLVQVVNVTASSQVQLQSLQVGGLTKGRRLQGWILTLGVSADFRVTAGLERKEEALQFQAELLVPAVPEELTASLLAGSSVFTGALQNTVDLAGIANLLLTPPQVVAVPILPPPLCENCTNETQSNFTEVNATNITSTSTTTTTRPRPTLRHTTTITRTTTRTNSTGVPLLLVPLGIMDVIPLAVAALSGFVAVVGLPATLQAWGDPSRPVFACGQQQVAGQTQRGATPGEGWPGKDRAGHLPVVGRRCPLTCTSLSRWYGIGNDGRTSPWDVVQHGHTLMLERIGRSGKRNEAVTALAHVDWNEWHGGQAEPLRVLYQAPTKLLIHFGTQAPQEGHKPATLRLYLDLGPLVFPMLIVLGVLQILEAAGMAIAAWWPAVGILAAAGALAVLGSRTPGLPSLMPRSALLRLLLIVLAPLVSTVALILLGLIGPASTCLQGPVPSFGMIGLGAVSTVLAPLAILCESESLGWLVFLVLDNLIGVGCILVAALEAAQLYPPHSPGLLQCQAARSGCVAALLLLASFGLLRLVVAKVLSPYARPLRLPQEPFARLPEVKEVEITWPVLSKPPSEAGGSPVPASAAASPVRAQEEPVEDPEAEAHHEEAEEEEVDEGQEDWAKAEEDWRTGNCKEQEAEEPESPTAPAAVATPPVETMKPSRLKPRHLDLEKEESPSRPAREEEENLEGIGLALKAMWFGPEGRGTSTASRSVSPARRGHWEISRGQVSARGAASQPVAKATLIPEPAPPRHPRPSSEPTGASSSRSLSPAPRAQSTSPLRLRAPVAPGAEAPTTMRGFQAQVSLPHPAAATPVSGPLRREDPTSPSDAASAALAALDAALAAAGGGASISPLEPVTVLPASLRVPQPKAARRAPRSSGSSSASHHSAHPSPQPLGGSSPIVASLVAAAEEVELEFLTGQSSRSQSPAGLSLVELLGRQRGSDDVDKEINSFLQHSCGGSALT